MTINSKFFWIITIALAFLPGTVLAETRVTKDELKELITGKTLEGKWVKWESNYRMYLDSSGTMKRIWGKGSTFDQEETGEWKINRKGKLCFIVGRTKCRRVKRRADGGYNLYSNQKELLQTIEKITDGNPYNL